MKAYELYKNDQAGSELLRKPTSRREYYMALRQALQDEGGRADGLLRRLEEAVEAGQSRLYLLDAAAVWECYEAVVDCTRFPRDLSRGFPFMVRGRTLPWSEVQSLSDAGRLPVAVADEQLRARLAALCAPDGKPADRAQVNPRARLEVAEPEIPAPRTVSPEEDKAPCAPWLPQAEAASAPFAPPAYAQAVYAQPVQADTEAKLRLEELQRENLALASDNRLLRGQLEQMRTYRESERDYAVRAARCILDGQLEEARSAAEGLSGELQAMLTELETVVTGRAMMEQQLEELHTRMDADVAQTEAFRRQLEEAQKAAEKAQEDREKAQESAGRAMAEKQAAEEELEKSRQQLASLTQSLRQLRTRMVQSGEASELMQRQLEALSSFM